MRVNRSIPLKTIGRSVFTICLQVVLQFCFFSDIKAQWIEDNFSTGFPGSRWRGDTSLFAISNTEQLQLQALEAGTACIYAPLQEVSGDVEIKFRLRQSFAGSANNHSKIGLVQWSGTDNDPTDNSGFYLQFGESGSNDVVRLNQISGGLNENIAAGISSMASSFDLNIRIVITATGLIKVWSQSADQSNEAVLEFTANINWSSGTKAFYWLCRYTSSYTNDFFLDDVALVPLPPDLNAPVLTNVDSTDPTRVSLQFNEPVNLQGEIYLNNSLVPAALIQQTMMHTIAINTDTVIPANITHSILITELSDTSGNTIQNMEVDFVRWEGMMPMPGDLQFTEVLADPTPAIALPEAEFIEIHNISNQTLDLSRVTLANSNTMHTITHGFLLPGKYAIITDNASCPLYPDSIICIGIDGFVSLSNTGDSLTLLNNEQQVIDILVYSDDWYDSAALRDGGISLELQYAASGCDDSQTWEASAHVAGGTPGFKNSRNFTLEDSASPHIEETWTEGWNQIEILFTESMFGSPSVNPILSIEPGTTAFSWQWSEDYHQLQITVTDTLQYNTIYFLLTNQLEDCAGNPLTLNTIEITPARSPEVGDIVINEIMSKPLPSVGGPAFEFIEVYNKTDDALSLRNIHVNNGSPSNAKILQPHEYMVFTDDENMLASLVLPRVLLFDGFPQLSDGGTEVVIRNAADEIIDEVTYSPVWYRGIHDDGGYSLERINPYLPCSSASNWSVCSSTLGSTACEQNSNYDTTPDITPPIFSEYRWPHNDTLQLLFDEAIVLSDSAVNITIGENETQRVYGNADEHIISVPINQLTENWESIRISIVSHQDCSGNIAGPENIEVWRPNNPESEDIVINEVMFDPEEGCPEYIELWNHTEKHLLIKGLTLADSLQDHYGRNSLIDDTGRIIRPKEFLVITESELALRQCHVIPSDASVLELNFSDLNADFDKVTVRDFEGGKIDQMQYKPEYHHPLLENTKGVSLERISASGNGLESRLWHSASAMKNYATPGEMNSQYKEERDESGVTIYPQIISPDNDGVDDILEIVIDVEREGWVGRVWVGTLGGEFVAQVLENSLLGNKQRIFWNGMNSRGALSGIGPYILFFEGIHPDGKTMRKRIPFAIAP
jgi:hypothetical protein